MPKSKHVNLSEIVGTIAEAGDLIMTLQGFADRVRSHGINCENPKTETISELVHLSRSASDLAAALLMHKRMIEHKAELTERLS